MDTFEYPAEVVYARADAAKKVRLHLDEMIETVIWMSGSADFGPEGQAHEGWIKAREKLNAAMAFVGS